MNKACYPGSFDPLSIGHLDIIKRASKLFDEVHILVSNNILKHTAFTVTERVNMIKKCTSDLKNVSVYSSADLVVNYCKENNINIIVRGLRNIQDYENEFTLYQFNRDIYPKCETVILLPSSKNQMVSSSAVKELVTFGVDISPYVPKEIKDEIVAKFSH